VTAKVTVGDAGEIQVLADKLQRPREVMEAIGALMQGRAVAAFRQQRRGSKAWAPRMVPNVPGIVRDLNAGGFPKSRRFEPRPAVVDTGLLRNSITWAVGANGRSVTVGTTVPYAATQNEGGSSDVTLTSGGRRQLTLWLRRDESARELGIGWLFSKPTFTVNVRARPFLVIDRDDRRMIIREVEREIERQSRGR